MMQTFRHDVLDKPEILYTWDGDILVAVYIQKAYDQEGTEYIQDVQEIPFIPDIPKKLPKEILEDLTERLPMGGYKRKERLRQIEKFLPVDEEEEDLPF
jgi:hypothetical protein